MFNSYPPKITLLVKSDNGFATSNFHDAYSGHHWERTVSNRSYYNSTYYDYFNCIIQ